MKQIVLAVLICGTSLLLANGMSTAPHKIYLPYVVKEAANDCSFYLSSSCNGPAQTRFPSDTQCVHAILTRWCVSGLPLRLHLVGSSLIVDYHILAPGWQTETICVPLCAPFTAGQYEVICYLNEVAINSQPFQIDPD